jgi:hypothetical protein
MSLYIVELRVSLCFVKMYNIVPCWRYLLGLQTTPFNLSHSFIVDYTHRYYSRSITVLSRRIYNLKYRPVDVLYPQRLTANWLSATLLTVDYLCWRPTLHYLLSAFDYLKLCLAGVKREHLLSLFIYAVYELVTYVTSVVYSQCIAVFC